MISDQKITKIFQIPPRMLQRWKNSNDYRYLIYTFLNHNDEYEVEAFFNYLSSKNIVDNIEGDKRGYKSNISFNKNIDFIYKKDFMTKLKENIDYLNRYEKPYEVIESRDIATLLKESDTLKDPFRKLNNKDQALDIELIGFTFFAKDNNNNILYVELSNRIVESKPLKKKITQIKESLKDEYRLEKMIFVTNESEVPKFIRVENNTIDDVIIDNINIDIFSQEQLSTYKTIFVPPGLEIPKIDSNTISDRDEIRKI